MALKIHNGMSGAIKTTGAYTGQHNQGNMTSGLTTPTPPWGAVNTGWLANKSASARALLHNAKNIDTYQSVIWLLYYFYIDEATLAATNRVGLVDVKMDSDSDCDIYAEGGGGSTFTLSINTTATSNEGSTTYNLRQIYLLIVRWDGVDIRAWIDGVEDTGCTSTSNGKPLYNVELKFGVSPFSAGNADILASQAILVSGSATSDLDESNTYPEVRMHYPNANGDHADYGNQTTCGGTGGSYVEWDDWKDYGTYSGSDYNCGVGGAVEEETSHFNNIAYTGTVYGARGVIHGGMTAASKDIDHNMIFREASTDKVIALDFWAAASHVSYADAVINQAPDGDAFSETVLDSLQCGHGRTNPAPDPDANFQIGAIAIEGIALGSTDPFAVTRRIFITG